MYSTAPSVKREDTVLNFKWSEFGRFSEYELLGAHSMLDVHSKGCRTATDFSLLEISMGEWQK